MRFVVAAARPWWSAMISPICPSIVCSGLSDVIGSWKTIVTLPAAHLAQLRVGHAQDIVAAEEDLARRKARRRLRQEPDQRLGRDRLARARFSDERERLALVEPERDAIDDRLPPAPCAKAIERSRTSISGGSAFTRRSFGVEGVAHRFPDEDQQREQDRDDGEGRNADPRRGGWTCLAGEARRARASPAACRARGSRARSAC